MGKKNTQPNMAAVIYARYSSMAQKDCSIEQQVAECQAYAKHEGYDIVGIYADRHISGTTDQRPQFQKMIKDAANAKWGTVICWKIDRFARNRYDSAMYKHMLKKVGVTVVSAKEAIPGGPEGILLEALLEGSAEYYSANLSQNVKRGLKYNASELRVNGCLPYGYRVSADHRFEVDPEQAAVVKYIFTATAAGHSRREIATALNANGVPTKRGGRWRDDVFKYMLVNEAYLGVYEYGDIRVEDAFPPIIDPILFGQVQAIRAKNTKQHGGQYGRSAFALSGKVYCADCGSKYYGETQHQPEKPNGKKPTYRYYLCAGHRQGICGKPRLRAKDLEDLVYTVTVQIVLQPDVIETVTQKVIEAREKTKETSELKKLLQARSQAAASMERIVDTIEAGGYNDAIQRRMDALDAELALLDEQILAARDTEPDFDADRIRYTLEHYASASAYDPESRQPIFDIFVARVDVYTNKICIYYSFTDDNSDVCWDSLNFEKLTELGKKGLPIIPRYGIEIFATNYYLRLDIVLPTSLPLALSKGK